MRKCFVCVPMITLCFLLAACGGTEDISAESLRNRYQEMAGCSMEAVVLCDQQGMEWEAQLSCEYFPDGESAVEVLSPETIAGVKAVFTDSDWRLEYEGDSLNAGTLSDEELSPALCLPRLMNALRDGWLLEENREQWGEIPCLRLSLDQSGADGGKIISTVWLRTEDGTPLRGEIAVDGENILTAEFTKFAFCDTMSTPDADLKASEFS